MSDVNIQLVREFFEINGFRVMMYWRHDHGRAQGGEHGFQLYVENMTAAQDGAADFVLRVGDVGRIERAVVEVRAWHADRMYASVIESNPVLLEVAGTESRQRAHQMFGQRAVATILVVSELPASAEARQRSIAAFQQAGINHVLEFPTVLHELLDKVSPTISYTSSDTLQILRLLKRYDFIRRQQLEFPFPTEPPVTGAAAHVEAHVEE